MKHAAPATPDLSVDSAAAAEAVASAASTTQTDNQANASHWLRSQQTRSRTFGFTPRCLVILSLLVLTIAAHIALSNANANAKDSHTNHASGVSVDVLLASDKTVLGETYRYPKGQPKITSAIVTIAPGAETGWHRHDAPLYGYVLEGEVTVDYGSAGVRLYRKGDSLVEAFQTAHNGLNKNTVPVRILTVYAGSDQSANSISVTQPN